MKLCPPVSVLIVISLLTVAIPAQSQIWRWVDRDGVLTFSNNPPPDPTLHATRFDSRWSGDESRKPLNSAAGTGIRRSEEWSLTSRDTLSGHSPEWYGDSRGAILLADSDRYHDDPHGTWEYNGATRYLRPYTLYAPYSDYAYSRRSAWGPRRDRSYDGVRPHYRRYLRLYQERYRWGQRLYDRHYFSSPYRYRSRVPSYSKDRPAHPRRGHYGKQHLRPHPGGRYQRGGPARSGHGRGYRGGSRGGFRR